MTLTIQQKAAILKNVEREVETKFYNPLADLPGWRAAWPEDKDSILASADTKEFEARVSVSLARLKSSHVAFFHGSGAGVPASHALNATFLKSDDAEPVWLFLDVLEGGVASKAGIVSGESLAKVDGNRVSPPNMLRFDLGSRHELTVISRDGKERAVPIALAPPSDKGRPPMSEVRAVHSRKLTDDIGYVRVAYFPGAAGNQFAAMYERALADLGSIRGLVIDLRGNLGGGLGSLRVMSSLCSDKRPIGYNISRSAADKGFRKEDLPRIDRIPSGKFGLLAMFVRFKFLNRDRSIALFTEGLGPRPFHGRIAILINEHTKSAAEMVADFAVTHNLATLVGTRTAGEVLGAVNFVVGEGYRLRMPIGGWLTWDARLLERRGVSPQVSAEPSPLDLRIGSDRPLEAALASVHNHDLRRSASV